MNCVRSSTFKYRLKSLYSRFSIQLIRLVGHSAVDGADDCTKVCSISKDLSSEKPIFDWPRPQSQDKTENKKYSTIILFNSTTKKKELRIPLYAKTACHRYAFAVLQSDKCNMLLCSNFLLFSSRIKCVAWNINRHFVCHCPNDLFSFIELDRAWHAYLILFVSITFDRWRWMMYSCGADSHRYLIRTCRCCCAMDYGNFLS